MDAKTITDATGAAAALASVASFIPQIVKLLRTRDASGVSLRTYALTVTGFGLWILYGWRLGAWPLTLANAAALSLSATVLVLKYRYRSRD